ncbi:MAG: hypothetical protein BWZ09_02286 [Alphaproteobacteria bacterium ADurb.BinA305]|nr:MAG: hypothetical protein BWZ09_02286 [Alphaproteobacteria bacterium ADurb.BinA305]
MAVLRGEHAGDGGGQRAAGGAGRVVLDDRCLRAGLGDDEVAQVLVGDGRGEEDEVYRRLHGDAAPQADPGAVGGQRGVERGGGLAVAGLAEGGLDRLGGLPERIGQAADAHAAGKPADGGQRGGEVPIHEDHPVAVVAGGLHGLPRGVLCCAQRCPVARAQVRHDRLGRDRLAHRQRLLRHEGERGVSPVLAPCRRPAFVGEAVDGVLAQADEPGQVGAGQIGSGVALASEPEVDRAHGRAPADAPPALPPCAASIQP